MGNRGVRMMSITHNDLDRASNYDRLHKIFVQRADVSIFIPEMLHFIAELLIDTLYEIRRRNKENV